jgi:Haem-binding domain
MSSEAQSSPHRAGITGFFFNMGANYFAPLINHTHMKSKILIILISTLVIIQFFRPAKNLSDDKTYDVSNKYMLSDSVQSILKVACNDCHSNRTEYPWYAEIQPVAWWLNDHVTDGKRHLNFSDFTSRPIAVQNHKFEETIEMVEEGEMPLSSYTWAGLHSGAKLTEQQRQLLVNWAQAQMDTLKAQYPPDSLVLKRR